MARLVSLVEFLNTGHLGPLKPGSAVREIADQFGPPKGWIFNSIDPLPDYWTYGRLEVFLDFDEEPRCRWFQIEHAGSLSGDVDILSDGWVMTLDGLDGESKIADFIGRIHDIDRVSVHFVANAPRVWIDRSVQIGFGHDNELPVQRDQITSMLAAVNRDSWLDSIYSYSPDELLIGWQDEWHLSGRAFLAALAGDG